MRIAIYTQDGLGLGHMRRTALIAAGLCRERPGTAILTLGDYPLGFFFALPCAHEHVALPTLVRTAPRAWRPLDAAPPAKVFGIRRRLIASALRRFRPDLLLVDHLPHGAAGELLPVLARLRRDGVQLALGLRDILDAPEVVCGHWEQDGMYASLEELYDRVLVFGQPDLFDSIAEYGLGGGAARASYCGYVCSRLAQPRQPRRGPRRIVSLAGGGADGAVLMETLLEALPTIAALAPVELALITGPFLPAPRRASLEARARGLPATVLSSVADARSELEDADVICCMAGYNTTVEAVASGRPALVVPRSGPSAEQRLRARLFADRGWVRTIDPEALRADRLADEVVDLLRRPPARPPGPRLGGVDGAVELLVNERSCRSAPAGPQGVARAAGQAVGRLR